MKTAVLALLLCVVPFASVAHPGKTDRYGGHLCIKGCEEWDLYYKEYHLHDKEGKPVRVAQKRVSEKHAAAVVPEQAAAVPPAAVPSVVHASVAPAVPAAEEGPVSLPWVLVLALLLVLLLIARVKARRAREGL